jgi:hypothetical protein
MPTTTRRPTKAEDRFERLAKGTAGSNNVVTIEPQTNTLPPLAQPPASPLPSGMLPLKADCEGINRLKKELWDTRREIAASQAYESSLSNRLQTYGVEVPKSHGMTRQEESDVIEGKDFSFSIRTSPPHFES